jgi:hydroxymethylglutaryl-CoA lyase
MKFPNQVRVVEVGPRDGLQNEKQTIPTALKIQLIEKLVDAGLTYIEAGSFVNPKWVPQMADSADVFLGVSRKPGVTYAALTPNLQGYERALTANANEVAIFAAASEEFSKKNINCSISESIKRFELLIGNAQLQKIPVRAKELFAMGCYEISLGDTIGVGTANQIKHLIETVANQIPLEKIAVHMHDTYGQGIANIYASLELGVSVVDSSIGGLGGCPYAIGASGNIATEDLVYLLNGLNISHGLDLQKLVDAGNYISNILGRPNQSKAAQALTHKSTKS